MIRHLTLKNFKSWPSLDIDLAPITLLFGTNSSGKTSILQALLMLKQTAASSDRGQPIFFGGTPRDYVNLGSYTDLVFMHDSTHNVSLYLYWESRSPATLLPTTVQYDEFGYTAEWQSLEDRVVLKKLRYDAASSTSSGESNGSTEELFFEMVRKREDQYRIGAPRGIKDSRGRNPDLEAPDSCYAIPVRAADYYTDFEPLEFNRQFENLMARILYLGPLRQQPDRDYLWSGSAPSELGMAGQYTIQALIASERATQRARKAKKKQPQLITEVTAWLQRLGLVASFEVAPLDEAGRYYRTLIQITEGGPATSLVDVGFGISQVLPVITQLLFAPEGSIVLIEQPELHLHPLAQTELADLFLEVAEKRGVQIIIESHSEHLLRRLQRRIAETEQTYATPETVKAYFCAYEAAGSTIQPVRINVFGEITNWPDNFFGNISEELDATLRAGIERRFKELANGA